MFQRLIAFVAALPAWLRPAFLGAAGLFVLTASRMAFAFPFIIDRPAKLSAFALGLLAATAAGAAGGFSWTILGRHLQKIPILGPYLAGIFCVGVYLSAIMLVVPHIAPEDAGALRKHPLIMVGVAILFGVVLGHNGFRD